jgi:UDP-N-acetylmuramoyl-L-alanyl-D-glutamate--2,6-diaminopimelate ligase
MGEVAGRVADYTIVTTDNPRTEKPEDIIAEIEAGISKTKGKYEVIVDRKEAIRKAIKMMNKRDIVILAGKGHEVYQEINGVKNPFDEREIVKEILEEKK